MDLPTLAQQATNVLVPALPFIYAGSRTIMDKSKDIMIEGGKAVVYKSKDMLLEKGIDIVGSETIERAESLLSKISPKMSASLEKALEKVSKNSDDSEAKEELQQNILKLLRENPSLAQEIYFTINLNIKNIENITIGNYIYNYNILESPSEHVFIETDENSDQKGKKAINHENLCNYNPSTLPHYPENLKQFVTENRSDELKSALIYLKNHRILLVSGVGGVGKSTFARALVDLRPEDIPEPFWFNFNQNQDAKLGDILEKLAAYLEAPEIVAFKEEKREPRKHDVDKLTDEFQKRGQIWLIFDDLNTMLEDQHFFDKGIELLFSSLRYNTHKAKIIITSRILPKLEYGENLIDVVEDESKYNLKGLSIDYAVDYLVRNGLSQVEPKKLEEMSTGVDCHPLALKLLVELVNEFGVDEILKDLSIFQGQREETILKTWRLFDKLAGDEKEFLEFISVYREPVSLRALKEVLMERAHNIQKNPIKKLIDKSLLETDHNGSYWLHPLVQEFSYNDLKDKKEAHMLAVKYYVSIPLPEKPSKKEDLQSIIEAHHHACKAGEFEMALQIILHSNLQVYLDLWGDYTTLKELFEGLLPVDPHKDMVLLSEEMKSFVFGYLGVAYFRLCFVRNAINYYEKAMKIANEACNQQGVVNQLRYLGIAYRNLGEPRRAIEYYKQALEITKDLDNKNDEVDLLINMANAYNDLREPIRAIELCEKALNTEKENTETRKIVDCLGTMGNAYEKLNKPKKAIEYYEKALEIAKEIGYKRGEVNQLGNLGSANNLLEEPIKSIKYCKQALEIAQRIGYKRGKGNQLRNMGSAYFQLKKPRKAIKLLEESLEIGKEIEDPTIISFCEEKLKEISLITNQGK